MAKNLVVGAGLSGAVLANLLATVSNEKILVIDRKNHIAGNIYDYKDEITNITVHKYGPHIFHTNNKKVWDYLSKYTKWHYFFLKPNVVIEGKVVSNPFTLTTIHQIFSENLANKFEEKLISTVPYTPVKGIWDNELKDFLDHGRART